MSLTDDLYLAGAERYKRGDFAAAESSFRQLLDAVPLTEGKVYARAAHSLALTLLERGSAAEAMGLLHAAIHADPGLKRARDLLTSLEAEASNDVNHALPGPSTPGGLVGIARRIRIGAEPDPIFGQQKNNYLRFRLETAHGQATIELRGQRISGSVEEGDLIEVPGPWRPGTLPAVVYNLTTGEEVKPAASVIRMLQWVILVGFLIGFVVFAIWAYQQVR
jgi:tetratricopeptide (TPR) repeat protein